MEESYSMLFKPERQSRNISERRNWDISDAYKRKMRSTKQRIGPRPMEQICFKKNESNKNK